MQQCYGMTSAQKLSDQSSADEPRTADYKTLHWW
jgi:hypothetical protein